ncbi:unnamed protein product [Peniophora sp. CBMAI 1063]|nr:unnamed protein product [Peniophora sp. CBMAI 1063]
MDNRVSVTRELPRSDPALWAKISADYARGSGEDSDSDDELLGMPDLVDEAELSDAPASDDEDASSIMYNNEADFGDDSGMRPADLMEHILAPREQPSTAPAIG